MIVSTHLRPHELPLNSTGTGYAPRYFIRIHSTYGLYCISLVREYKQTDSFCMSLGPDCTVRSSPVGAHSTSWLPRNARSYWVHIAKRSEKWVFNATRLPVGRQRPQAKDSDVKDFERDKRPQDGQCKSSNLATLSTPHYHIHLYTQSHIQPSCPCNPRLA